MATLTYRTDSKYYQVRYYDATEPVKKNRDKRIPTDIPITKADLKRIADAKKARSKGKTTKLKLYGNNITKEFLEAFEEDYKHKLKLSKSGFIFSRPKSLTLNEVMHEFEIEHSRPEDPEKLSTNTIKSYKDAVRHFINSATNKLIATQQKIMTTF